MNMLRIGLLLVCLVFVAGCANNAPTTPESEQGAATTVDTNTTTTADTSATTEDAYPAAQSDSSSDAYPAAALGNAAYPAGAGEPTAVVPSGPFVEPEPASDQVGVAFGRLLAPTEQDGELAATYPAVLYLGSILSSDQGAEGLVQLDKGSAPRAETDTEGNFGFTDVEPGRYGLWIDTPQGALLLNQPSDGGDLIVEITGGEQTDLGELEYNVPLQ